MAKTYEELYADAQKAGKVETLTFDIFQFKEEGDRLVGRIMGISLFEHGEFDTKVNQYLLDTDNGPVSTVLGSATDGQIAEKIAVGDVVSITFRGKATTRAGNQVNRFSIELLERPKAKS